MSTSTSPDPLDPDRLVQRRIAEAALRDEANRRSRAALLFDPILAYLAERGGSAEWFDLASRFRNEAHSGNLALAIRLLRKDGRIVNRRDAVHVVTSSMPAVRRPGGFAPQTILDLQGPRTGVLADQIAALTTGRWRFTTAKIAAEVEEPYPRVIRAIQRLRIEGRVEEIAIGVYRTLPIDRSVAVAPAAAAAAALDRKDPVP